MNPTKAKPKRKPRMPDALTLGLFCDPTGERFWFGCPTKDVKWWGREFVNNRRMGYHVVTLQFQVPEQERDS